MSPTSATESYGILQVRETTSSPVSSTVLLHAMILQMRTGASQLEVTTGHEIRSRTVQTPASTVAKERRVLSVEYHLVIGLLLIRSRLGIQMVLSPTKLSRSYIIGVLE